MMFLLVFYIIDYIHYSGLTNGKCTKTYLPLFNMSLLWSFAF